MASPQSALLVDAYRELGVRLRARSNRHIHQMRVLYEELHRVTAEPPGVSYTAVSASGIPALWCVPPSADTGHALLYCHGGGFQVGSIALYRKLVGHLAVAAGVPAIVFDYRLAPEHCYPAQLEDTACVQRWLAHEGVRPECTVVVGDSAGANLGTAHVLQSVRAGQSAPAGIVAMSPWYDLTLSSASITARQGVDVALTRSGLLAMREAYLAGDVTPDDPCASPLYADLAHLPPTLLLTGDHEILLDDTLHFAEKAQAAGIPVEMALYPGMPHVFPLAAGHAPEADDAVIRAGRWARERLGLTPR